MPTNKNARVWTGTEWANISAPVAVPNAISYYQTTAPSSPSTGQVWVNSTTGTFYVWSGTAWQQQNVDLSAYLTSATAASTYVSAATVASTYAPKASPVFTGTIDASSANFIPPVQTSGRNRIINGSFDVWQRGLSITTASGVYTADRWYTSYDGSGSTRTITAQEFTLGAAPVPGYESKYFLRYTTSVAGSGSSLVTLAQKIEGVRTLAGQTLTVSFWARGAANLTMPTIRVRQNFGTGGSPSAFFDTTVANNIAVTTSWQRFTYSITLPSISAKSIGTNNNDSLEIILFLPTNALWTFDIWGVQLEAGAVATPFETEPYVDILRKCQRYFFSMSRPPLRGVFSATTTWNRSAMSLPVPMRIAPTVSFSGTFDIYDGAAIGTVTGFTQQYTTTSSIELDGASATGSFTVGRPAIFYNGLNAGVVSVSAEL